MLFDDDEQLEVRHVISLAHHDVSIYSGGDTTPEGELFIKRNAICLSRNPDGAEIGPDSKLSKPFYLFSENCSAKEDFYFALLRNQGQTFSADTDKPTPSSFEVKHIISLVQKLHSSEEYLQTRWLNAMIGRIFLGVYRTKDVENFIREKLTKKISRVKRPSFLSNIAIKEIYTGDSAPYITNPRLKDLTVEGECGVEADLRYTGNFRLEVAATARIDLGPRFKAREVNLVLAVVIRKVEGRGLFKIKPPPSNRIWYAFQQMPKMEMTIEPIVSSRQITYTVILRQIENRIKEVIAESLVLPFWDDVPFFRTEHKKWRGGIWEGDDAVVPSEDFETHLAQMGEVDEVDRVEENGAAAVTETELPPMEKSHSLPVVEATHHTGLFGRKIPNSKPATPTPLSSASTSGADIRNDAPLPRVARSGSFTSPPTPVVATSAASSDIFRPSSSPPDQSPAAAAMAASIAKSQTVPPSPEPLPSSYKPYVTSRSSGPSSSKSSAENTDNEKDQDKDAETTPQARRNTASSTGTVEDGNSIKSTPKSKTGSVRSQTGSLSRGIFSRRESGASSTAPPSPAAGDLPKRTALGAVTNAAISAKRWGLNAIQRHNEGNGRTGSPANNEPPLDLNQPMGRGRPLPPPGVPLPMPERSRKSAPIPVPKKRLSSPPPLPDRSPQHAPANAEKRPVPPPPLPRRSRQDMVAQQEEEERGDGLLVVAAPEDTDAGTPISGGSPSYMPPYVENTVDDDMEPLDDHHYDESLAAHDHDEPHHEIQDEPANTHDDKHLHSEDMVVGEPDDEDDYSAWMGTPEAVEQTGGVITSEGMAQ
jgi:hypothetical protein